MSRIIELANRITKKTSNIDCSQLPEIHPNVRQVKWGDEALGNYEVLIVDTNYQVFTAGRLQTLPSIEYNRRHNHEPLYLEAYTKNPDGTYTLATHIRSKGSDAGTGTYFTRTMTISDRNAKKRIQRHMENFKNSNQNTA